MKTLGNASRIYPPRTIGVGPSMNVAYTDLANIFTLAQQISLASAGVVQTFQSTFNDANPGITDHYRLRGATTAGQDGDDLWEQQFNGLDDTAVTPVKTKYARTLAEIVDSGNGSEDGRYSLGTMRAGTVVDWQVESGTLRYQGLNLPATAGALAATAFYASNALLPLPFQVALFQDQKSNGTNGGNSVATTWTKRAIGTSTAVVNSIGGLALASDVLTIGEAGTYLMIGRMPFGPVQNSNSRLQRTNNTPATIALGSNSDSGASNIMTDSWAFAVYTTTNTDDTVEFQYWTPSATTNGLGTASSNGIAEVYAHLFMLRLA